MHIRWIAAAGVLALASLPALSACSAATSPKAGASASTGSGPAVAATPLANSAGGQVVTPGGVSNADLAEIDQQLSDAANSLGAADADANHNESGDATP